MKILSLFDGMSCGQIALQNLGLNVETYYASELDKYAIAVTQHNFPNTVQLGDVTKWKEWNIDWSEIDLLQGGSPCQGFSFAGKQLAFDDPRSALFFVFVDILNHIKKYNPNVKFLLENVRMKKEYLDIISEHLGVQPIMINSALVSAQNRVRFYWTNIEKVTQPEDRGIILRDILESREVEKNFILSDKRVEYIKSRPKNYECKLNPKKTNTLRTNYGNASSNETYTTVKNCIQVGLTDTSGYEQIRRIYSDAGKSPTLTTMGGGNTEPKVALDETQWRKLTPMECERLQTVPDNYTLVPFGKKEMSNSQRYKMLGNGWTVDVIKHIYSNLNHAN